MLYRFYNHWQITNSGEKEADRQLSLDRHCADSMYALHSLRLSSRYHRSRMAGECDFVVITRQGVTVIEVKGGIIGYGSQPDGGIGYYRLLGDRKKESFDDPFIQVDGNADAIQKYLKEKGLRNIFVGKMVCFPECGFKRSSLNEDDLWHREHEQSFPEFIRDSLERQIEKFREIESRSGGVRHVQWKQLDENEVREILDALQPQFIPDRYKAALKLNLDESDRRTKEGLSILSGLDENRRLIIQGPPGSGKSVYALAIIMRLCKNERLKGLYVCWNELLMAEMQLRLSSPEADVPPEKIKTKLYFDLAVEFGILSGDPTLIPSREIVSKGGMRECVKGAVSRIRQSSKIEKFDFVVIDEAQDIFDKGIDFALRALLKVNNPLQNGRYYIFFDDSQDYPGSENPGHYIRTRDMFKANAACYSLTSNLRVNTGNGISGLINDAQAGIIETGKSYGEDVIIREWTAPEEVVRMIKLAIIKEREIGSIPAEECIVLLTADLIREQSLLFQLLDGSSDFEFLKPDH